jgi:hypothetical protein
MARAREELQRLHEQRKRFCGVFVRYGNKGGWKGCSLTTVLLRDIVDIETGTRMTDHLWFIHTEGFRGRWLGGRYPPTWGIR